MSGGAATHSEAVPEWRGLDAQAVAIDVADTRAPFHVVATHQLTDGMHGAIVQARKTLAGRSGPRDVTDL